MANREGGVNSKTSGFIGASRNYTSSLTVSGIRPHDDWYAPETKIVALLDRGIESIHVNVKNESLHTPESDSAELNH